MQLCWRAGRGGAGWLPYKYRSLNYRHISITMFIFTSANLTHAALLPSSKTYRIYGLQFYNVAMVIKLAVRRIKKISPCVVLIAGFVASKIRDVGPNSFAPSSFSGSESD